MISTTSSIQYHWLNAASRIPTDIKIAAIASDFAVEQGPKEAEQFLADAGVELINRVVDNSKHYGEAMTIDLFVGSGSTITPAMLPITTNKQDKIAPATAEIIIKCGRFF